MIDTVLDEQRRRALDAFGWAATSSVHDLRLEGVGASGYQVGRVWSPDGRYRSLPQPDSMYVLLTVEGTGTLTHAGVEVEYSPDHIVFVDGEDETSIELAAPTSRYLWRFGSSALRTRRVRERIGEPIPVHESVWAPVRALTNSLLGADPAVANSLAAARASESLLGAIFDSIAPAPSPRRSPDGILAEALALIGARRSDPAFTAERLAQELQASPAVLAQAFTFLDLRPEEEINRQRAQELHRRIVATETAQSVFARLAEASGFRTPELALQALAHFRGA